MKLRWRIAEAVAGRAILADPFPGHDGVMVIGRSRNNGGYRVTWALKADQFKLKASIPEVVLLYGDDEAPVYRTPKRCIRFVGTVR